MKLQVKDWDQHFENFKSRERDKCSFVCVPNKQDGLGFQRVLSEPDGAAIYGVWHMIIGALSRQPKPRKGYLTDSGRVNGEQWTPEDLSMRWRRPIAEIQRALTVLTSPKVGWIIDLDAAHPDDTREVSAAHPPRTLEENRSEGNEEKEGSDSLSLIAGLRTDKKTSKQMKTEDLPPVPSEIDTPEFLEAWNAFKKHRAEMKKRVTPAGAEETYRRVREIGVDEAVKKMRQAIASGWQGWDFEKGINHGKKNGRKQPERYTGEPAELGLQA